MAGTRRVFTKIPDKASTPKNTARSSASGIQRLSTRTGDLRKGAVVPAANRLNIWSPVFLKLCPAFMPRDCSSGGPILFSCNKRAEQP